MTGISKGCQKTDSILVQVKRPFSIAVSLPDTLCISETAQLHASAAKVYRRLPATGLNSAVIANPIATPSATTTYTLIVLDNKN